MTIIGINIVIIYAYQILSKSNKSRLKYRDITIFKMAAVHRLEFLKLAILVGKLWLHVIPLPSSKFRVNRTFGPQGADIRPK